FICEAYRRCQSGKFRQDDFEHLEKCINTAYRQILKHHKKNSTKKESEMNGKDNDHDEKAKRKDDVMFVPPLKQIAAMPTCIVCQVQFSHKHYYTICGHGVCFRCLLQTFHAPPKSPKVIWFRLFYLYKKKNKNKTKKDFDYVHISPLPPESHFFTLSHLPDESDLSLLNGRQSKKTSKGNGNSNGNGKSDDKKSEHDSYNGNDSSNGNGNGNGNGNERIEKNSSWPLATNGREGEEMEEKEETTSNWKRLRNGSYKNMLKVVGEHFGKKLKRYQRWRKCENCEFGFLADPDINWHQIFELKCAICQSVQRVQLIGPGICQHIAIHSISSPPFIPSNPPFSQEKTYLKTLLFIRHGQAMNNVRPTDPALFDPFLTEKGKFQCLQLKEQLTQYMRFNLVLVSTMNRTLQTAALTVEDRVRFFFFFLKKKKNYDCSSNQSYQTNQPTNK
ncbi:hypothetical protein RFI_16255, partial [Reticulomyxa filosa]